MAMMLAVMAVGANAQISKEAPTFELSSTGSFVAPDGKDYIVYPIDGKSAHELFQMVCTNVGRIYNSPKDVMSVVEDKSVSIRAYSDGIMMVKLLGIQDFYNGYYNLLFEFKDGKIRISAPVIGSLWYNGKEADYQKVVRSYFEKDGSVKEKHKDKKNHVETKFNILINQLIAANESEAQNDDW